MNNDQITALAREYAEEMTDAISFKAYADPEFKKELHIRGYTNDAKEVIDWLTRRYCLVEKRKLEELEIARRAKEHGAVWLNQWEAEYLFPEIAKEVEETQTNNRSHENPRCENEL